MTTPTYQTALPLFPRKCSGYPIEVKRGTWELSGCGLVLSVADNGMCCHCRDHQAQDAKKRAERGIAPPEAIVITPTEPAVPVCQVTGCGKPRYQQRARLRPYCEAHFKAYDSARVQDWYARAGGAAGRAEREAARATL
jgi:hypothetical protein